MIGFNNSTTPETHSSDDRAIISNLVLVIHNAVDTLERTVAQLEPAALSVVERVAEKIVHETAEAPESLPAQEVKPAVVVTRSPDSEREVAARQAVKEAYVPAA